MFWCTAVVAQPTLVDRSFTARVLHSGDGMISIEHTPDGALLVAEKRGRVLYFAPDGGGGFRAPRALLDLAGEVDTRQESGLLGLAVDPGFATSRHVFLFYTTRNDQRLVRATVRADYSGIEGAPAPILTGLPRTVDFHKAGDIQFAPNDADHVFIAIGDDNERRWVQDPTRYHGKILRVRKTDGQGVSTNPFWDGNAASVASRVWAVGLRNPFRFVFHPLDPNVVLISENGDDTDRLSWARRGSNGGWGPGGDNGGFLAPPDANHKVLATQRPSTIGVAVAGSGPFADGDRPVVYLGNWLAEGSRGAVYRYRLEGPLGDRATPLDGGAPFARQLQATDLSFGPDGALYATWSGVDESRGGFHTLTRITKVGGRPPVAAFGTDPDPPTGSAPLTVRFMDRSTDPDGRIVALTWRFGDGQTATEANPTHTYAAAASYPVTLTVRDDTGLEGTARAQVVVTENVDVMLEVTVLDGRSLAADPLVGPFDLSLFAPDGQTPIAAGGSGPDQNRFASTRNPALLSFSADLPGGRLVVRASAAGLQDNLQGVEVRERRGTARIVLGAAMIRGRALDGDGQPARIDLGLAMGSRAAPHAVPGGRDLNGLPPSGALHRVESDALGYYAFALPAGAGRYFLDAVADLGADRYVAEARTATVSGAETIIVDLSLTRATGPRCLTIGGLTNVDFGRDVLPFLRAKCADCHGALGGLRLGDDPRAALVDRDSVERPGRKLVVPGDRAASFLFEKLACQRPSAGARMHASSPVSPTELAALGTWIDEGAKPASRDPPPPTTGKSTDCDCDAAGGGGWGAILVVLALRRRRR